MFHLFWGLTIKIGFLLCKPQIIWGSLGYTNWVWDKPMLKSWVSRILRCCWSRDLEGFRTFVQLWQIVILYSLKYHRLLFKTLWLGLLIVEYVHAAPVDMRKTFHIVEDSRCFCLMDLASSSSTMMSSGTKGVQRRDKMMSDLALGKSQ